MEQENRDRIAQVMFALDLGFSDIHDDENVRQATLERKLAVIERAVAIMRVEEAMNYSLFV